MRIPTIFTAVITFALSAPSRGLEQISYGNADVAPRLCGGVYLSRDSSYKAIVPDIGSTVAIFDRTITPGITAHATFTDLNNGFLYIVSTKIREDLPKDDSVLQRVATRYERYITEWPKAFSSKWTTHQFGKMFEFVFLNVSATPGNAVPYPLGFAFQGGSDLDHPARVGVHRFLVSKGYLFEFAALVHTGKDFSTYTKDQLIAKGYDWIDTFTRGFEAGTVSACADL